MEQQKNNGPGCIWFIAIPVFIALLVIVTVLFTGAGSSPGTRADRVVVRGEPGGTSIAMVHVLRIPINDATFIRNGTVCERISGPHHLDAGGRIVVYDRLDCNGNVGYVAQAWVRPYR